MVFKVLNRVISVFDRVYNRVLNRAFKRIAKVPTHLLTLSVRSLVSRGPKHQEGQQEGAESDGDQVA